GRGSRLAEPVDDEAGLTQLRVELGGESLDQFPRRSWFGDALHYEAGMGEGIHHRAEWSAPEPLRHRHVRFCPRVLHENRVEIAALTRQPPPERMVEREYDPAVR